jgi:hypothetical protein
MKMQLEEIAGQIAQSLDVPGQVNKVLDDLRDRVFRRLGGRPAPVARAADTRPPAKAKAKAAKNGTNGHAKVSGDSIKAMVLSAIQGANGALGAQDLLAKYLPNGGATEDYVRKVLSQLKKEKTIKPAKERGRYIAA